MSYYVQHDGQQLGPFTEAEVKAKLASGAISATDYVWWEGQASWQVLNLTPLGLPVTAAAAPIAPAVELPPAAVYVPVAGATSQLAIWALVCGCVGLLCGPTAIAAIVLGHMALNEFKKKPGLQGKGMAIAGLVIGYVFTTIWILWLCLFCAGIISGIASAHNNS